MVKLEKLFTVIILLLVSVLFVSMLREVWTFGVDDSYIFFRYAENVSNGNGFVFNAGEPAGEGFTSWAWLLLLSLFHYVGLEIVLSSKIVGILFHVMGAGVLYLLAGVLMGKDGNRPNAGKLAGLILSGAFLLNYRLVAHSVSGMETSLYIFIVILLAYLTTLALKAPQQDEKWWLILSLTTTAAFLVRPEGIAAGGISLLVLAVRRRAFIFKPRTWLYGVVGLVIPVALLVGLKMIIFGYPLPHSYYHKRIVIASEYGESARQLLLFLKSIWWVLLPGIATAAITAITAIKKKKQPFILYTYIYYIVFFLSMVSVYLLFYPAMNYLHRFYIPYWPLLLLMLVPLLKLGIEKIGMLKPSVPWRAIVTTVLLAVLCIATNARLETARYKVRGWSKMIDPADSRARLGVIMKQLPPELVVANTEMGVIPFYSGLTCLDMAGLTDPHMAHHGVSMEYLKQRNVGLILFPRDVRRMTEQDWKNYTQPYGSVFLSETFRDRFRLIGWHSNYYLYADSHSTGFDALQAWGKEYLKPVN
jgi:arabinofuranosyltransferase